MPLRETIAAIATALAPASIGIVRISGPASGAILEALSHRQLGAFRPHCLQETGFYNRDGVLLDRGLAVWMPAPRSYTGEDVVELHGHGSLLLLQSILRAVLELGASLARPGEFTRRALESGRIDLLQAEAVRALIAAPSMEAAGMALHQLGGRLSRQTDELLKALQDALASAEGAINFPEEVPWEPDDFARTLCDLENRLCTLEAQAEAGDRMFEPPLVVIAGKPNVGKSSLLNALLRHERAIVTPIPGTTRDGVEADLPLPGGLVRLVDTAGMGETDELPGRLSVDQARAYLGRADWLIFMADGSEEPGQADLAIAREMAGKRKMLVCNKMDLGWNAGWDEFPLVPFARISALQGTGLEQFRTALQEAIFPPAGIGATGAWLLGLQQREALRVSRETIHRAILASTQAFCDIAVAELRLALQSLREFSGKDLPEDVLDQVFSRFCLGK